MLWIHILFSSHFPKLRFIFKLWHWNPRNKPEWPFTLVRILRQKCFAMTGSEMWFCCGRESYHLNPSHFAKKRDAAKLDTNVAWRFFTESWKWKNFFCKLFAHVQCPLPKTQGEILSFKATLYTYQIEIFTPSWIITHINKTVVFLESAG